MDQITVKELLELCEQAIKDGHGDKYIVVADDNEGNGYHGLYYGFGEIDENFDDIYDSKHNSPDDTITLG
jgi:hypothetical protein